MGTCPAIGPDGFTSEVYRRPAALTSESPSVISNYSDLNFVAVTDRAEIPDDYSIIGPGKETKNFPTSIQNGSIHPVGEFQPQCHGLGVVAGGYTGPGLLRGLRSTIELQ